MVGLLKCVSDQTVLMSIFSALNLLVSSESLKQIIPILISKAFTNVRSILHVLTSILMFKQYIFKFFIFSLHFKVEL